MAFNIFRNPFESLSAENQDKMVKSLNELKDYFFSGNTIVESINEMGSYLKEISKKQDRILDFLIKKDHKQLSEKDQKEMSKTANIFGKGLQLIVNAIKDYSKLPEDAVDSFVLSIEKIGKAFIKLFKVNKEIDKASDAIVKLGKSIVIFGLLMLAALPIYLLAAIAGPIVIAVVSGIIWLFTYFLADKMDMIGEVSESLPMMAGAIILFGLSLIVASKLYGELIASALGLIAIFAAIALTVMYFEMIGEIEDVKQGVINLSIMGLAILGFGLILYLAGLVYAQLWTGFLGMVAILLTIGALVFLMAVLDSFSDTIMDGVKALATMVLIVLATGLLLLLSTLVYSKLVQGAIDSWPIFVVITALIGLMFLIDKMKSNIYQGAMALFVMVASLGLAGLILYVVSNFAEEMQAGLGASWPILVLLGALIGLMFFLGMVKGQILQGSLALGAVSIAVLILAAALYVIKKADWTAEDTKSLSDLIITLALVGTVLGVLMEAGMLPLLGAAAMAAIGLALLPLAYSLKVYKESGFNEDDALVFGATIVAISAIGALLGNPFTYPFILAGAVALGAVALALVPFTNSMLTFKKSGFSEDDAESLGSVISTIVEGFTTAFDNLTFEQMAKIRTGINALSGIGNVMTGLARGIQDFANMKFIEYEVVKNKDGVSEIRPRSINKLSDADIQNAGINFRKVISAILDPIKQVGIAEASGEGWFSGDYISKGIKALTGIGGIMTELAIGVQSFANLTFTKYKVVGEGADAKIVPDKIEKIDMDTVLPGVALTFEKVVTAMIEPLAKVGMQEKQSSGIFSGGYVSAGIKALTGIGAVMTDLAKGVQGFANLTFQKYKLDEKTGKLVPDGNPQNMGETEINRAKIVLDLVINSMLDPIINAGKKYDENQGAIDSFSEFMPGVLKTVNKITESAGKLAQDSTVKGGVYFKHFVNSILDVFNQPDYLVAGLRFRTFASNADILIKGADKFEKVASSFERIADAFGEMKGHINSMELTRLTQVTKLMGFLDGLANGKSDDIVADVGEAISKGMQALKDILEEIKDQLGESQGPGLLEQAATAIGIGPGTAAKPEKVEAKPETQEKIQDMQQVVIAINNLRTALLENGIKVKGDNPLFNFK
jgi:hypothetical protein